MVDCKLSIIIPCYNAGKFIKDTIEMFEAENVFDCEIIIVNDGSQDNTLKIVKELEKVYNNISIVNQKNEGVSSARNKGLQLAMGEYVYFFDSDDRIETDVLGFYKKILRDIPECDVYAFGYQKSRDNKIVKRYSCQKYKKALMNGKDVLENIFYGKLYLHICACIFKRDFLLCHKVLFPEGETIGEDSDFIRKSLINAKKVYYDSEITFTYQLHPESQTVGDTYTLKKFSSFGFMLKSIDGVRNYVSLYASNFFVASRYVSHVVGYLKSDLKDKEIEMTYKNYRYLLFEKIRTGNFKWTVGILFLRLIPLDFLFKIFK